MKPRDLRVFAASIYPGRTRELLETAADEWEEHLEQRNLLDRGLETVARELVQARRQLEEANREIARLRGER